MSDPEIGTVAGGGGPLHIAHVANFYGPRSGGLRTAMHEMARGYRARGHQVTLIVASPEGTDEQTEFGRRIGVPARELPGSGGYRVITDVDRVTDLLDDLKPDRLEVSDRATLRRLGGWARDAGVPSIMWAHERLDGVLRSWLPAAPLPARTLADLHNRRTARAFDRIACTTAFAAEEFERIGAPNVVRVPLGVDLEWFRPDRRDQDLRARLLGEDEHLIVMASRLSREKRPEIAMHALAELRSRGVRARLVIAGDGPYADRMRRLAWGMPAEFLGFVTDRDHLAALLASADVVLAPGPIETFGLAALEALASGTPVIASRTSALREIVTDGAGITVAPAGAAFADAVEQVLAVEASVRRAAARARAEQFPWSRSVALALALHARPVR